MKQTPEVFNEPLIFCCEQSRQNSFVVNSCCSLKKIQDLEMILEHHLARVLSSSCYI